MVNGRFLVLYIFVIVLLLISGCGKINEEGFFTSGSSNQFEGGDESITEVNEELNENEGGPINLLIIPSLDEINDEELDEECLCNIENIIINEGTQTPYIFLRNISEYCGDNEGIVNISNILPNNHFFIEEENDSFILIELEEYWWGFEDIIFTCNNYTNNFSLGVNRLNNSAPYFISGPELPPGYIPNGEYTFSVEVNDTDGDLVSIEWYFNDELLSITNESTFFAVSSGVMRIEISDGWLGNFMEFYIDVPVAQPPEVFYRIT